MVEEPALPLVIAHRGAAGEAPENTLAAFRLAVEQQCDMIELDVQMTSDGEIVVCHDESVDRTTNGTGPIREMEADRLRGLDAGSWFSPAYRRERVPTLREVFETVPASIGLNIEVKSADSRMEARLLELIRASGRTDSVLVSSFDHRLLHRLKTAAPDIRIGLLYSAMLLHPVRLVRDFGREVYSVHPHHLLIAREDVEALRANGQRVYAWTANVVAEMKELIEMGVAGVITDYPSRMRKLVPARRA